MELTKRTLVRHLLLAGALIGVLPLALGSQGVPLEAVASWAWIHRSYLTLLALGAVGIGILSERGVKRHKFRIWFLVLFAAGRPRAAFRDFRKGRGALPLRLLLLWGGCSRCVSYWLGGVFGAACAAWYWRGALLAVLYFALVLAALSAAIATAAHLRHTRQRRPDQEAT